MKHYLIKVEVIEMDDGTQPVPIETFCSLRRTQSKSFVLHLANELVSEATRNIDKFNHIHNRSN